MTSKDCPRFNSCNASLCPLGPDASHTGYHAGGDPVCYYLRMSGKAGAAERFADDPAFAACLERLPAVVAVYPDIGRKVAEAAKSGFPGGNSDNLTRRFPHQTPESAHCRRGVGSRTCSESSGRPLSPQAGL